MFINDLPFWMQIILAVLSCSLVSVIIYFILINARKNIKIKGFELKNGNGKYLTGKQTIELLEKSDNALEEKLSIKFFKRLRDQMGFVEQINDYIREILLLNYKKLLSKKNIKGELKKEILKGFDLTIDKMLKKQKKICRAYFKNISGSIKDVGMNELKNPDSELCKSINKMAAWQITKASETIDYYYIELNGSLSRAELFQGNQNIVPEILKKIKEALITGHEIHIKYDKMTSNIDKDLQLFKSKLLSK